jgi:hypothetical protein
LSGKWGIVRIDDPDFIFDGELIHSRDVVNKEKREKTLDSLFDALYRETPSETIPIYVAVCKKTGNDYLKTGSAYNPLNAASYFD